MAYRQSYNTDPYDYPYTTDGPARRQTTQVEPTKAPDYGTPSYQDPNAPVPSAPAAPTATAPTYGAGPVNGDYQGWFNQQIAGKPFNQQTLLDLEPMLKANGMALTPPNSIGERTKIQLPTGEWVRVGFGEGKPVWVPQGMGGAGSAGSAGSASGAGRFALSTPYTATAPTTVPSATAAPRNPAWEAFYKQLMARSNQSLVVDPNNPAIHAQTDAYRAAQTRDARANLAAVAEAAGPNTNISAETRRANELVGQNTAGFQAQLLGREVDARRLEIAQALAGMQGQLTTEESSRLREEDQSLAERQLQLGAGQQNWAQAFADRGQDWNQAFQDRGWGADQAQRAWEDQYRTIFG